MSSTCANRKKVALSILKDAALTSTGKVAANCPLHKERIPGGAFFYDPEEDSAYCFSCEKMTNLLGVVNALKGRRLDAIEGYNELEELLNSADGGNCSDDLTLFRCHCGGVADICLVPPHFHQCQCTECGCAGPRGNNVEKAVFNWNILAEASFSRDKSVADLLREHTEKERAKREAA